jgi:hypothetical protein
MSGTEEKPMSVQMVIELREKEGVQSVLQAIEAYKTRLRVSIDRTKHRLQQFEEHYQVGRYNPFFAKNGYCIFENSLIPVYPNPG